MQRLERSLRTRAARPDRRPRRPRECELLRRGGTGAAPQQPHRGVRVEGSCTDSDNNAADFNSATPSPRNRLSAGHFCEGDNAPGVSSTTPANGAVGVALDANITVTFSENVDVTETWYTISCTSSGPHTAVATGGPQVFTLNPDTNFALAETCTLTVSGSRSPIRI